MHLNGADFTLTFRRLCDAAEMPDSDTMVGLLFADPGAYDAWASEWRKRLTEAPVAPQTRAAAMRRTNPAFIPRNHRVEAVITAAVDHEDFQPFEELLDVVTRPYDERPELESFSRPARPEERVLQTFCGT
jgi:serine/tyrosine/threonine adenylyltransferase